MSLLTLLLLLVLVAIIFGGWGQRYGPFGYWGWSPLGALVVVIICLWALGVLHG